MNYFFEVSTNAGLVKNLVHPLYLLASRFRHFFYNSNQACKLAYPTALPFKVVMLALSTNIFTKSPFL